MTNVTYSDLLDLISNGQLVPDSEYCVTDYPTFQPILKARTESELWRDGYTSGGYKLLYNPFNTDGEYTWSSTKGWVYYLEANNNSAWFDFLNYGNLHNSNGVHIGPTFDSDGHRKVYSGNILQCVDVEVAGEGSLNIIGCQNTVVGSGNSGELRACQWVTVGDDNTNLSVVSVTGSSIGDGNTYVTLSNTEGVSVNSRNSSLDISGKNNIIGSDNSSVTLVGDGNEILNSCRQVTVTSGCNEVDESASVEIDSEYNKVTGSSAVVLKNSVGNTVDDSKLVYLEDVNNNDLWVNQHINSSSPYTLPDGETVRQYYPGEPEPFVRVRNIDGTKVRKVVEDMIPEMEYQTDNSALVVNTVNEKTKGSAKSNDTWYMGKDGLWNTDTTTTDEYDVTVIISKSQSLHCYTSGAGRYMDGQTCTVDYTWLDDGWVCRFMDENGNTHTSPYTFIVTGNTKIVAVVVQEEPQPLLQDEIRYTSTNDQVVTPYNTSVFGGAVILSNTYEDGEGLIKFDRVITEVGYNAFRDCTTLSSVLLPDSVTTIGSYAFYGTSLTSFHLPKSVTSVSNTLFGLTTMTQLEVDEDNTVYDSRNSCNAIIHTASNELKVGCSSSTVPNTVTSIGYAAFDDIRTLTSITIPASVTTIGTYAFNGCAELGSITLLGNAPSVSTLYFSNFREYGVLYGQAETDYSSFMAALPPAWTLSQPVVSPDDEIWYTSTDNTVVTPYATGAFGASIVSNTYSDGKGIIKFNGPVTQIGGSAFYNRSKLASICIPNSATSTGTNAFYQCDNLASVTIGSGLTSIGDSSFRATGLTSIHIPQNVTSLGSDALRQCDSLVTAAIVGQISRFNWCNFYGDSVLANLVFYSQDTVPTIGTTVFTGVANSGNVYGQPGLDYSAVMNALPNAWTLVQ